jgi:hypothetical protein
MSPSQKGRLRRGSSRLFRSYLALPQVRQCVAIVSRSTDRKPTGASAWQANHEGGPLPRLTLAPNGPAELVHQLLGHCEAIA